MKTETLIEQLVAAVEQVRDRLEKCPDCEFDFPVHQLFRCRDCNHIACSECLELHYAEPHADDISNSPEAHGAWRRYDS